MTTDYRIERDDVRGIGPTVRDHLDAIDIDSVAALHLLATRGGRSWRQLEERGVGQDALEHLHAVGKAVKGLNHAYVRSKHLTADFATDEPDTMTVSIETQEAATSGDETNTDLSDFAAAPSPGDTGDTAEPAEPGDDTLADALSAIRDVYDDDERGMDAWMAFSSDIADFLEASDRADEARDFYQPAVQHAIVRYPLPAPQVADEDALDPVHLQALVDFAASLTTSP